MREPKHKQRQGDQQHEGVDLRNKRVDALTYIFNGLTSARAILDERMSPSTSRHRAVGRGVASIRDVIQRKYKVEGISEEIALNIKRLIDIEHRGPSQA